LPSAPDDLGSALVLSSLQRPEIQPVRPSRISPPRQPCQRGTGRARLCGVDDNEAGR
jgi:hypothetical protein